MSGADSGAEFVTQLFVTATTITPNAVWLGFYSIALLVAVFRMRTAPVLGLLLLFIAIRIATFGLRVHEANEGNGNLTEFRAAQGLLAVGYPILCDCVLTLTAEHFATAATYGERRHRLFVHLLGLLLLADVIVGIYYAVEVGKQSLGTTVQAYIVLQFVFLGLLFLHLLFRGPFLYRQTTAYLILLVLLLVVPPIYLELRYKGTSSWINDRPGISFHVLWELPEALVTIGLLWIPLYVLYPNYRSQLIY